MSGNGVRIGTGVIAANPRQTPRGLQVDRTGSIEGVVGVAFRGLSAFRVAAAIDQRIVTTILVSAWFLL